MSAHHFFVGVGAGVALLALPALALTPAGELPGRFIGWIEGPPPGQVARTDTGPVIPSRPVRGYVPGADGAQPADEPTPPPTLSALGKPEPTPGASVAQIDKPAAASGVRTGVVHSGGQPARVRHVAGADSPDDAQLPDGSPVLVSAGPDAQGWRSVRGLNGVSGWIRADQVAVDGEAPPQPAMTPQPTAQAQEQLRVANTGGVGVALRRSPNDADRIPSGLRDGATVSVVERAGSDWVHIHTDTGQDGWVPARYLSPLT
jgi:SH3-like domain-containing protein